MIEYTRVNCGIKELECILALIDKPFRVVPRSLCATVGFGTQPTAFNIQRTMSAEMAVSLLQSPTEPPVDPRFFIFFGPVTDGPGYILAEGYDQAMEEYEEGKVIRDFIERCATASGIIIKEQAYKIIARDMRCTTPYLLLKWVDNEMRVPQCVSMTRILEQIDHIRFNEPETVADSETKVPEVRYGRNIELRMVAQPPADDVLSIGAPYSLLPGEDGVIKQSPEIKGVHLKNSAVPTNPEIRGYVLGSDGAMHDIREINFLSLINQLADGQSFSRAVPTQKGGYMIPYGLRRCFGHLGDEPTPANEVSFQLPSEFTATLVSRGEVPHPEALTTDESALTNLLGPVNPFPNEEGLRKLMGNCFAGTRLKVGDDIYIVVRVDRASGVITMVSFNEPHTVIKVTPERLVRTSKPLSFIPPVLAG